jgi:hypothetical protein
MLLAPTLIAKQTLNYKIEKRIDNMWRTHRNRVDRGLPGTYSKSGYHLGMTQDFTFKMWNVRVSPFSIVTGITSKTFFNMPHLRWHHSFGDYPDFLNDIDNISPDKVDTYERIKPYRPDPKSVVGTSSIVPKRDDDEKFNFVDTQGEHLYSPPPDGNQITIDHGLDEEHIWRFGRDLYNQ